MEKEFIPYEQALELKELGFDEPCLAFYNGKFLDSTDYDFDNGTSKDIGLCIVAPLYQQAFRFFREKYNLIGHVRESWSFDNKMEYVSQINGTFVNHGLFDKPVNRFDVYEEAELECLKKLIEIVKNK
jgi:hypothetical protein